MTKKLLFVCQQTPCSGMAPRENFEMLLLAASLDYQITVLFIGDGIWQLKKQQLPQPIAANRVAAALRSLPIFDVNDIFVAQQDLQQRQLDINDLILTVTLANKHKIAQLLHQHDIIINF